MTIMQLFRNGAMEKERERESLLKQMYRTCGGSTTPHAMGRYNIRTGSTGLGSIRFTSPRMTGHRHRSVLSPPSPAALEVLRNADRPEQHSLSGVGVSGALPVRNVPQVISAAKGVTQSAGEDDDDDGVPGEPNDGGTSGLPGDSPGVVGGGGVLVTGLAAGLRGLTVPGPGRRPGNQNGCSSAASQDDAAAMVARTTTIAATRFDME
jgi:hypothetical protein